jgi:hypothetical protein
MLIKKDQVKWASVKKDLNKGLQKMNVLTIENIGGFYILPKLDLTNKPTSIEDWCKKYDYTSIQDYCEEVQINVNNINQI